MDKNLLKEYIRYQSQSVDLVDWVAENYTKLPTETEIREYVTGRRIEDKNATIAKLQTEVSSLTEFGVT